MNYFPFQMEQNFKRVFRLLPVKQIADIIFRSNTPVCMQVKLWRLCDPEQDQPSSPELTLQPGQGKLELVHFHPTSSGLLVVATAKSPLIWDTSRQEAPLAALWLLSAGAAEPWSSTATSCRVSAGNRTAPCLHPPARTRCCECLTPEPS
ncbi:hypothetical protein XENOCAPTIV_026852 [Xenoophorus captivus]|uniref:Uncharacterized protein n=1 Tax=Xenoophorus captivus TaxID=1517983 RepID=A0ABV0QUB7_9TELE